MRTDMRTGMRTDMRTDMCTDMRTCMRLDIYPGTWIFVFLFGEKPFFAARCTGIRIPTMVMSRLMMYV